MGERTAAVMVTSSRSLLYAKPGRNGMGIAYAATPEAAAGGWGGGCGGPGDGAPPGGQKVLLLMQLSRV